MHEQLHVEVCSTLQTSTLVTLATALAILQLRSAHSVYFGAGATCAAGLAKVLKHLIRQPRPDSTRKQTFGMPSTHSASIGFMGTYLVLASLLLAPHPLLTRLSETPAHRCASAGLAALLAVGVWWSRIRLGHHTTAQVVAGGTLGSSMAVVAFVQWEGLAWLSSQQTALLPRELLRSAWVERVFSHDGWRVVGRQLKRIAEDAIFAALDAWKSRDVGLLWDAAVDALWAAKQALFT